MGEARGERAHQPTRYSDTTNACKHSAAVLISGYEDVRGTRFHSQETTPTPFQNATWSLISEAAGFGSG